MKGDRKRPLVFPLFLCLWLLGMVASAFSFSPKARQFPLLVGVPTLVVLVFVIVIERFPHSKIHQLMNIAWEGFWHKDSGRDRTSLSTEVESPGDLMRAWIVISWLTFFVVLVYLIGFFVGIPLFILAFLMGNVRMGWLRASILTAGFFVSIYILFHTALHLELWPGIIPEIIPAMLGGGIEPPL